MVFTTVLVVSFQFDQVNNVPFLFDVLALVVGVLLDQVFFFFYFLFVVSLCLHDRLYFHPFGCCPFPFRRRPLRVHPIT